MDEEQEHKERPRPRVVDKRVSARVDADDKVTAAPAADTSASEGAGEKLAAEGGDTPSLRSDSPRSAGASLRNSPGGESAASAAISEGVSPPGAAEAPTTAQQQVWTPEQEAEMRAMAQQIAETPSRDWVLNTAVTLANVAGTKLDLGEVADAQLAIDALGALVETLGPRLGEAEAPLRQTLAQLRMAYAQMVAPPPPIQQP